VGEIGRFYFPGPFDLVVEIVRPEGTEDKIVYRRLFNGEVVVEGPAQPDSAGGRAP